MLTYLRRRLEALEDGNKKLVLTVGKIGSGSHYVMRIRERGSGYDGERDVLESGANWWAKGRRD